MRLKITKPGYHDKDGQPVEVGTIITVKGDDVPSALVNKCEIVADDVKGKEPATGQKSAKRKGLEGQAAKANIAVTDDMTDEQILEAIKAKG